MLNQLSEYGVSMFAALMYVHCSDSLNVFCFLALSSCNVVGVMLLFNQSFVVCEGPGQFRDRSGPDHFRGGDFRRDRFPPRREGCVLPCSIRQCLCCGVYQTYANWH